jgi:hypothetical protein
MPKRGQLLLGFLRAAFQVFLCRREFALQVGVVLLGRFD